MKQYVDLLQLLLEQGERREQARGMPAYGLFGQNLKFDLRDGFPLVTVKRVPFTSVIAELVGFMRGVSTVQGFNDLGTKIWDANGSAPYWADNPRRRFAGDLGRIYGVQWRSYCSLEDRPAEGSPILETHIKVTDQLADLIAGLKHNPQSRRHVVTAWNPGELDQMALPPCHILFQCYVSNEGYLDLQMYQRSCDAFLGLPFNIASYAALLTYLATVCGYKPRFLHISLGDVHLYENQLTAAHRVVDRVPMPLPRLTVTARNDDPCCVAVEDFILEGYQSHPAMPVDMVV